MPDPDVAHNLVKVIATPPAAPRPAPPHVTLPGITLPALNRFIGGQMALPVRPAVSRSTHEVSSLPAPGESVSGWARRTLGILPRSATQARLLDDPSNRIILNCARQWGKSTLIALKALHAMLLQPGLPVSVVATRREQASLLACKVTELAARLKLHTTFKGKTHTLALPNGSSLKTLPHNAEAVRGYSAGILIFDEAAFIEDGIYHAAIAVLAQTNGQLWLLSTPNAQEGLFYVLWHEEGSQWSRHHAPVTDYDYAPQWLIEHEQRHNPRFQQEWSVQFAAPAGRLFSREVLEAAVTRDRGPAIIF